MTDVKKNKIGRPRKFHTKEQKKEYLKLRSREYYSSPEAKEKQRLKMLIYQQKNKDKINARRRRRRMLVKLEKDIRKIWISRGLLQ
tara:strand:- start:3207 stop:3464 length:258 start_codon:yes stop_codon:yes gene_type:complete